MTGGRIKASSLMFGSRIPRGCVCGDFATAAGVAKDTDAIRAGLTGEGPTGTVFENQA
jgi:hypothetical protein